MIGYKFLFYGWNGVLLMISLDIMERMINDEAPKFSFAIIKHRGDLNHAETADGYKVERQEKVWITEPDGMNGRFIFCSPDDVHFIYIDPMWTKIRGRWFAMCSCGSPES